MKKLRAKFAWLLLDASSNDRGKAKTKVAIAKWLTFRTAQATSNATKNGTPSHDT
jgi:hypothetical protein